MYATDRSPLFAAFLLTATLSVTLAGCHSAAPPDDTALNSAIQRKLANDSALSAEPIQSSVQSGVAILQGNVSSEAARALAASDASQIAGIRSVVNQLNVQTGPSPSQTAAAVAPQRPIPSSTAKPAPTPRRGPRPPELSRNDTPPPPAPIERRSSSDQAAQAPEPTPRPERRPLAATATPPPPPAPSFRNVTVPAGTTLPVRLTQTLDSATAQQGDTFSGTIASDVLVDGLVALPAGTTVSGRLDQVQEATHFKGNALLTLSLVSFNRRGERTAIATDPYTQQGKGRGTNTAEKAGGGAAVGAILGGILGGGRGAAIGAAAGGGAGVGVNGVTRGQQVQIPSETLIRFRLSRPVEVRATTAPASSEGDPNLQHHPGAQ